VQTRLHAQQSACRKLLLTWAQTSYSVNLFWLDQRGEWLRAMVGVLQTCLQLAFFDAALSVLSVGSSFTCNTRHDETVQ
jgi:hypothetical protein